MCVKSVQKNNKKWDKWSWIFFYPIAFKDFIERKLLQNHMGGTSQEGKRPKNWEFYPLRIGFSWPLIYF